MTGGRFRSVVIGATVFSLLLSACEIEFTSDVVPLEIGEAPPGSFTDQVPEAEAQPELAFTSAEAMALCGNDLAWGDGAMGACLAPGGDYYYIWSNPNEVYFVPVNASDPDQLGFLQAVIARTDDVAEMQTGARDAGVELTALGITVHRIPHCLRIRTTRGMHPGWGRSRRVGPDGRQFSRRFRSGLEQLL